MLHFERKNMADTIPTYDDILDAAQTIKGEAVRTPLLRCDALDKATQCRVFVKPENMQRTGSFKFRGAYNAISKLSQAAKANGILASSSGNHAQGVAEAARLFGCKATIIMPSDAPAMKVERTKASGAKIVLYDRITEDREEILLRLQAETGSAIVHPFNNAMVIAGQGTVGLEISEDINAMGMTLDRMIVCTGGGGLTAGVATAIKSDFPNAKIHATEPEGFDDYKRSLESGKIETNVKKSGSICDAIISPTPGTIGFEINKELLHSGLLVSDDEALDAMRFAFEELKMVVEPGGAVALACVLKYGRDWQGDCVALTLSGGNVDPNMFVRAIS